MRLKQTPSHACIRPLVVGLCIGAVIYAACSILFGYGFGLVAALVIFVVFGFDARARVEEYHVLKLKSEGKLPFPNLHRLSKSFCGRGVAVCLYGDYARQFYHRQGYRWYHILPEGSPGVFFTTTFYKKSFNGSYAS